MPKESTTSAYDVYPFKDGNLSELRSFSSNNRLLSITKYEYDIKQNPFNDEQRKNESVLEYSRNNPLKITHTDHTTSGNNTELRYEYSLAGYPLKISNRCKGCIKSGIYLSLYYWYIMLQVKNKINNNKIRIKSTELLSDNWYTLIKVTFDYQRKDGRKSSYSTVLI